MSEIEARVAALERRVEVIREVAETLVLASPTERPLRGVLLTMLRQVGPKAGADV